MTTMPYRCLSDFLENLSHAGLLDRIDQALSPCDELGEYIGKTALVGGNAMLFPEVQGYEIPCLGNLFGTEERICRALDAGSLPEVGDRIGRCLCSTSSGSWFERFKAGAASPSLEAFGPRLVKSAAVQQIVRLGSDIALGELPLLQMVSDPKSGCAIQNATVISADPDSHLPIFGRVGLQPIDAVHLAVCWADYDELAQLLMAYRARGQKMPLAVVIGGDPGFLLAAAAPAPAIADVCAIAGLLREKSLDVVACRSVPLHVPSESEILLEGVVDPEAPPVVVGPLCGPLGLGTGEWKAPILQVTALTHRANPIYIASVPQELCTVARAMQRVFLPLTQLAMPELIDYDLPEYGGARHWAIVSIRKTHAGQGRRAAQAAWGLPACRFAKVLVVVDENVNVHDHKAVLAAIAAHADVGCDIIQAREAADPFDPASIGRTLGNRLAFDATRKLPGERCR